MSTPVSTRPGQPEGVAAQPDAWARRGGRPEPSARWKSVRRSRRIPYLLLGVILVVACAAAAVIVSMQLDNRHPVLVLAQPVTVGRLLSTQDLRQVAMPTDSELDAIPADEASTVLGRPIAYSLPAGTVLTRGSVGDPAIPGTGYAVTAVSLKAGQFPPSLAPGARVAVLVSAASMTAGTPGTSASALTAPVAQWVAMVVDVGAAGQDRQTTVVSLQLPEADARQFATAPSDRISLVALSAGGR